MIIVKLELHSARTGRVKEIGRLLIDNISRRGNDSKRADYRVRLLQRASKRVRREGRVLNYPRLSYDVWRLVFRALRSVMHEEDKPPMLKVDSCLIETQHKPTGFLPLTERV